MASDHIHDGDELWELLRDEGHLAGLLAATRMAYNTIHVLVPGRPAILALVVDDLKVMFCAYKSEPIRIPILRKRFSILACLVFIQDPTNTTPLTPALWVLQTVFQFRWQTVNHHVLLAHVTTPTPLKYRLSLDPRNNLWTLHQLAARPARLIPIMWVQTPTTKEQAQAHAEQLLADMFASQHPDKIILCLNANPPP